jgi:predicted nuclease with TOPRIM domain
MLKHTVKYWEIEAQTDNARWLRVLEDYERLKDKSTCQAECLDAFDVKLSQAETEMRHLKAEVERLRKAGDEMEKVIILAECIAGVEHTEKSAIAWNAAKEGKQS